MSRPEVVAYIAIGSNIEPLVSIPQSLALLAGLPGSHLVAQSGWYLTRPWGLAAQACFINLVVALATRLSAGDLLLQTQDIERRLGRERAVKYGPRTIDLDLILFGDERRAGEVLTLPHPGLLERDFMLLPLIEIAPGAIHPEMERPLAELTGLIKYRQIVQRFAGQPAAEVLSAARCD